MILVEKNYSNWSKELLSKKTDLKFHGLLQKYPVDWGKQNLTDRNPCRLVTPLLDWRTST